MEKEIRKGINSLIAKPQQFSEAVEFLKKNSAGNQDEDRLTPFLENLVKAVAETDAPKLKEALDKYLKDEAQKLQNLAHELSQKETSRDDLNREITQKQSELEGLSKQKERLDNAEQIEQAAKEEAQRIKTLAETDAVHIEALAEDAAREEAQNIIRIEKEREIQQITQKNNELNRKINSFEQTCSARLLAMEEEHSAKLQQLETLRQQIEAKIDQLAQAEVERAQHAGSLQDLEAKKQSYETAKRVLQQATESLNSQEGTVAELQLQLQDKNAQIQGLSNRISELSNAQLTLDNLSLEIHNSLTLPENQKIVEYVNELQKKETNALEQLAQSRSELDKANTDVKKLENANKILQKELDIRQQSALEVEANQRLVKVYKAIYRSLGDEIANLKNSLDKYVGNPCRELSEIDGKIKEETIRKIQDMRPGDRQVPDLRTLVEYVQWYANDKGFKYELDNIRAFVAGLATSPLIILQGMSGTGKTSLPRIFSEALNFHYSQIAVESSWRDRNDLLGYYNDFSRQFNAKDFTKELYKAAAQKILKDTGEIESAFPRFITLDEMNLSRIEYYFSDFLSELENPKKEDRKITLCTKQIRVLPAWKDKLAIPKEIKEKLDEYIKVKGNLSEEEENQFLWQVADKIGSTIGPKYLEEGRRIYIPEDLWFIGTANKDDSTFTITDKVYDRAQVLNLNEKWDGPIADQPGPFYVTSDGLKKLFHETMQRMKYAQFIKDTLAKIDEVLKDEFRMSYGYRIEKQAIVYAHIFYEAGGTLDKALDYQISTKILRKVENSDNSDGLKKLRNTIEELKFPSGKKFDTTKSVGVINEVLKDLV